MLILISDSLSAKQLLLARPRLQPVILFLLVNRVQANTTLTVRAKLLQEAGPYRIPEQRYA